MGEQITITKIAQRWQVVAGRLDNCRMWFYAPGLEVYVKGAGAAADYATIANIALNEALARHIPAVALRSNPIQENKYGGTKPPQSKPHQKSLFPLDNTIPPEEK
jgi:hypothetical protein